jgi:tricorn protease-like protein
LLPGGKALLYTALGPSGGSEDSRIVAHFLGSKERKTLVERAIFGRYLSTGHLIYATNAGTVLALPFDPSRVDVTGEPVPVLSDIGTGTWGGAAFLAVSDSGTLVFLRQSERPEFVFRAVDSNGHDAQAPFKLDVATMAKIAPFVQNLRISPDWKRFALTGRGPGTTDVWILEALSGEAERLTFDPAEDEFPVWSPDGRAVAYTSSQTGSTRRIFIKSVGAGAQPRLVRTWPRHIHVSSWSPDGRWLAAYDYTPANSTDIWAVPVDGKEAIAIANGPATEFNGQFSPDGRWIAYVSNESSRPEVYVVSFPALGSRRQVSTDGGTRPQWDGQGRTLFYLQNGYLVAHEVNTAEEFSKGRASRLFATEAVDFQVTPGLRFVLTETNLQPPDSPLYLVLNWFEELKRLVPTGR